jgi:trigger factor
MLLLLMINRRSSRAYPKQFGTAIPQEVVAADSDVTGTFKRRKGINNATTIAADLLKTKQLLIYSLVKK